MLTQPIMLNLPFVLVENGYTEKTSKEIKHDFLIKTLMILIK